MKISLMIVPGRGHAVVDALPGQTLADLVVEHNLTGRSLIVDGIAVDTDVKLTSIPLTEGLEVVATTPVKGA